ncbi:hypothetical protein PFISCL1PPCAC_26375, partial [Pristionchus fissidentatus]
FKTHTINLASILAHRRRSTSPNRKLKEQRLRHVRKSPRPEGYDSASEEDEEEPYIDVLTQFCRSRSVEKVDIIRRWVPSARLLSPTAIIDSKFERIEKTAKREAAKKEIEFRDSCDWEETQARIAVMSDNRFEEWRKVNEERRRKEKAELERAEKGERTTIVPGTLSMHESILLFGRLRADNDVTQSLPIHKLIAPVNNNPRRRMFAPFLMDGAHLRVEREVNI